MQQRKNTKPGKIKLILIIINIIFSVNFCYADNLDGKYTNIKILDKISSKNTQFQKW